jgi:hypothetical protein
MITQTKPMDASAVNLSLRGWLVNKIDTHALTVKRNRTIMGRSNPPSHPRTPSPIRNHEKPERNRDELSEDVVQLCSKALNKCFFGRLECSHCQDTVPNPSIHPHARDERCFATGGANNSQSQKTEWNATCRRRFATAMRPLLSGVPVLCA